MRARSCGCLEQLHEHGCRNRYDGNSTTPPCRCQQCRDTMRTLRRTYPSSSRRGEDLDYLREEIAFFAGFKMTPERIAERVGLTPGAIEQRGWRKK